MIHEITNDEIRSANKLLKQFNYQLESNYKSNPFIKIVMYDNKGIIVYSKIYNRIEIDYIAVEKKHQNQGIATNLLNYVIEHNDIDNITLEVKKSNNKAINFYKKNNFQEVALRQNYYNGEDAILMMREFDIK